MVRAGFDRLGKHIQVRSHEERLAGPVAIISVVSIDHGADRCETHGRITNDEIANFCADPALIVRTAVTAQTMHCVADRTSGSIAAAFSCIDRFVSPVAS